MDRKKAHQEKLTKRKNFLPAFFLTVLLWILLTSFIFLTDPDTPLALPAFFLIVLIILFFTFSLIFANKRRGLIASFATTLFLLLRYLGVGNILNLLLIIGAAISFEYFFYKNH